MQSTRQNSSWDDPYCVTLSAQRVRLAMARRDRSWDTILEVFCLPKSAPPSHRTKSTEERFLQFYMNKRQGIEDDFLPSCQNIDKLSAQLLSRGHILSLIFGYSDAVKCSLLSGIWEGSNFKIDSLWKEEQRETKETNFSHTVIIPKFHIHPVHHKL